MSASSILPKLPLVKPTYAWSKVCVTSRGAFSPHILFLVCVGDKAKKTVLIGCLCKKLITTYIYIYFWKQPLVAVVGQDGSKGGSQVM